MAKCVLTQDRLCQTLSGSVKISDLSAVVNSFPDRFSQNLREVRSGLPCDVKVSYSFIEDPRVAFSPVGLLSLSHIHNFILVIINDTF